MEEAAVIEKLVLFGLGRQEAALYLCLLKNGELTGYEAAKLTGISRSNVYNGLASLVEHGASYVLEGTSTKYVAVKPEEFCDNRIRYLKQEKEELLRNVPQPVQSSEGYITIAGYSHICDKIRHMLLGASQRIYFSASCDFLEQWKAEIRELADRQIKVVLISDRLPKGFEETGKEQPFIFYRSLPGERDWEGKETQLSRKNQIRLIIDSAYVLTGEVMGGSGDTCLYSAQKNFVNVFKEAMSNEIKLIEISKRKA